MFSFSAPNTTNPHTQRSIPPREFFAIVQTMNFTFSGQVLAEERKEALSTPPVAGH